MVLGDSLQLPTRVAELSIVILGVLAMVAFLVTIRDGVGVISVAFLVL